MKPYLKTNPTKLLPAAIVILAIAAALTTRISSPVDLLPVAAQTPSAKVVDLGTKKGQRCLIVSSAGLASAVVGTITEVSDRWVVLTNSEANKTKEIWVPINNIVRIDFDAR